MVTVSMNSDNSKAPDPHRLLLNFSEKINLKRSDKYCCLIKSQHLLYMKNIKSLAKKNIKLKISVETLNEQFELPDESYSVSYIQEYFEYIIKKHKTVNDNLSIKIYLNKTENRIAFKIKTRYYLELLLTERTIFFGWKQ